MSKLLYRLPRGGSKNNCTGGGGGESDQGHLNMSRRDHNKEHGEGINGHNFAIVCLIYLL